MPDDPKPSAEVVRFPGRTTLELSPDSILQAAVGKLEGCVIVGFDKDGKHYFASSYADSGDVIYHLEWGKWRLMRMEDEIEEKGVDPRGPDSAA